MSSDVAVVRDILIYFDNFFFKLLFVKFDFGLRFVINTATTNFKKAALVFEREFQLFIKTYPFLADMEFQIPYVFF